jgi:hypothetical protein
MMSVKKYRKEEGEVLTFYALNVEKLGKLLENYRIFSIHF